MGFYYECDGCGAVHPVDAEDAQSLYTPARACDACGADGCSDCVSHASGLCAVCEGRYEHDGCLACLNGWDHGVWDK